VSVPINDQGINGPAKYARAYLYGCGDNGVATTQNQKLRLLENDVLQARDPYNILGYAQPTDGDPLQDVDWYVFGNQLAAGQAAARYAQSTPAWAKAFDVLADTPGSARTGFGCGTSRRCRSRRPWRSGLPTPNRLSPIRRCS
jgi:hypothetical protein